jgi:hypothetical protein
VIRIDAISITGLPRVSQAHVPVPYAARVNCVLHSGPLQAYQELEVVLNGVLQAGVHEGDQIVFTWQFSQASDEVRIALLARGMRMRHWQGCWNERDAILHAGTLPVQVFFDGKPQPLLEATLAAAAQAHVPSLLAETVNGSRPVGTAVLERAQEEDHGAEGGEIPREEAQRTVIVQDLLVIAASGQSPEVKAVEEKRGTEDEEREEDEEELWNEEEEEAADKDEGEGENDAALGEVVREAYEREGSGTPDGEAMESDEMEESYSEEEDEEEGYPWEEDEYGVDDDDVPGRQDEETTEREWREGSDEAQPVVEAELREAVAPPASVNVIVGGDEAPQPVGNHGAGRRLAAFHAGPLDLEKTLQSLKDLLASLPAKTLIVDVRPKERPKKKYQQQDGLSKQVLRSVFGAKYWDRAWAIAIVSQMIPPADRSGFSTWRYVVDKPESHPDGIPALAQKLAEGYSMVVIDDRARYEESRRRAVIEELQQRIPALDVGPLG